MAVSFNQAARNDAMREFVLGLASHATVPPGLSVAGYMDEIKAMRDGIRAEMGGGGMCHMVTEWLQGEKGLGRLPVSYLDREGVIISDGHYVNFLPDGTIVDATADQFGEGHDVRVLAPSDPEYGRYRPEFDSDYNPSTAPELAAWIHGWTGETDWDASDRILKERGFGWWVDDPTDLLDYLERRRAYAEADLLSQPDMRLCDRWSDEVRSRFGAGLAL